jgi:hypothetical protein
MTLDFKSLRKIAGDYAAAWSSGSPEAVASFYAADGKISINGGEEIVGTAALREMAQGFYSEFPDLVVRMDDFRLAGGHALFAWTLEGKHSQTGNFVRVGGWEEWSLAADGKVQASLGWFDAVEYDRQVAEGI